MTKSELLKTAKPILFNTDMVRAIQDRRKSVTRRVVKPQPTCEHGFTSELDFVYDNIAQDIYCKICGYPADLNKQIKAPYRPGDILYVRETWMERPDHKGYIYLADYKSKEYATSCLGRGFKWHPSIHMPKEAARIFLEATNVRVERVQDIEYFGCINEGLNYDQFEANLIAKYASLWNSTIPKKQLYLYGWDANPWVWVIEFERLEVAE